ncbi:hypothetical protein D3C76_940460 [compost metagenome]|uniref:hypothetical protein n=1 Tax=Pseudomonas putida TaxID=303 RepID=UPI000FB5878C|nr:hypothetical protein [Pseudomonas putida]MBF8672031.1 hypothetical protein [Pseudomonas putida]MBF8712877.1 hypothetical protein [Pseudomonas putida]
MKIFFEGDRGKALCEHCQAVVPTHYARRDVPFSDGQGVAKDILVGVCARCDGVVAIPSQSTPAIREARKQQLKSIEARLPAVYLDVLDAAMHAVSNEAGANLRKLFLAHYFQQLVQAQQCEQLHAAHQTFLQALDEQREQRGLARSNVTRRLSMKVNPYMAEDMLALQQHTEMNQTELLKAVIARIQADVLENRDQEVIRALQRLARLAL